MGEEKGNAPTEKQLSYLKSLGYDGKVKSKKEASSLISELKKKKYGRRDDTLAPRRTEDRAVFLTKEPKKDHYSAKISKIHIAEQTFDEELQDWDKTPFCRNGGLDLSRWYVVRLNPKMVYVSNVCGICRMRADSKGYELNLGSMVEKNRSL